MSTPTSNEGFVERLHVFGTQSYESAYLADVVKYNIRVDGNLLKSDGSGVGSCMFMTDDGPVEWKRESDPLPPLSRVSDSVSSPVTIAAGGYHQQIQPAHTPQMVPPLSSIPQPASQAPQPAPPGPATKLTGAQRRFKLFPLRMVDNDVLLLDAERFTMAVELDALDSFAGWPDQWSRIMRKVVDADDEPVTFYLCVDTAGGSDSWTFCNIPWANLQKLQPGWPNDQSTYELKNKLPLPPVAEMDQTQLADVWYGIREQMSCMRLYQTLVDLTPARRSDIKAPTVSNFALGVVIAIGGLGLPYLADGILGLGRADNIHTGYGPDVRFKSQSFHASLVSRRIIARPIFYISIGHNRYERVDADSHYISFGLHVTPSGDIDKRNFTAIEVLGEETTRYRGKWTVFLEDIIIRYADRTKESDVIRVRAHVVVDSGATQTYLHAKAYDQLTTAMTKLGAPEEGWCGQLHRNDDIIFVFGRTKVHAEARMFLASPLSSRGAVNRIPLAVKPTSGSTYLLGVNFFRAFIVGFDEFDKPCIWLRSKASTRG